MALSEDGSVWRWVLGRNHQFVQCHQEGFEDLRSRELLIEGRIQ